MAAHLPVELVSEIWHAAAELFIETDHRTVLSIAASCTIGYNAATPVLYRTLLMTDDGAELVMRVFDTKSVLDAPTLSTPPAQRLCPLVRRLCAFTVPDGLTADDVQRLTGLETVCDSGLLESFLIAALAPTLTHLVTWNTNWPQRLPPALTHVSLCCYFGADWASHQSRLKAYMVDTLPDSVTHFTLSICYPLAQEAAAELVVLLRILLERKGIALVSIWLFGEAVGELHYRQVLCAIAALRPDERNRVLMWRDLRTAFHAGNQNIRAAAEIDVVAGRTVWTEARPVMQEELTAAAMYHACGSEIEL